uniref:Uncharacterized protein n=1 Tax=Rousettus aegyptiacus TaxID=9407 RepID=A0A7J8BFY4_ROUAE|nr:hypothetical protein HJG63_009837 [Rousettus aegyptiacus]
MEQSYTINATKGGNVFYRSPRHLAHSTSSTRFRKAEGEEASQHPGRLKLTGKASAPGGMAGFQGGSEERSHSASCWPQAERELLPACDRPSRPSRAYEVL